MDSQPVTAQERRSTDWRARKEASTLSPWMQYSRQVDWPARSRVVIACGALSALWAYALTHNPGEAGVVYALLLLGTLGALVIGWGECTFMRYECDWETPPRTLREMWTRRQHEIREAPLMLVGVALYVVGVCVVFFFSILAMVYVMTFVGGLLQQMLA